LVEVQVQVQAQAQVLRLEGRIANSRMRSSREREWNLCCLSQAKEQDWKDFRPLEEERIWRTLFRDFCTKSKSKSQMEGPEMGRDGFNSQNFG
jgi:hypothetical protein